MKREYSCSRCSRRSEALLNHVRIVRVDGSGWVVVCSRCAKRAARGKRVFANVTFTWERATVRSHGDLSRGVVFSCRARWHMRRGTRVPRAVSRARATAARTPKPFPALVATFADGVSKKAAFLPCKHNLLIGQRLAALAPPHSAAHCISHLAISGFRGLGSGARLRVRRDVASSGALAPAAG